MQTDRVLANKEVLRSELPAAGQWASVVLRFDLTESRNSLSFRTYWNGRADMDVAVVRVRHRSASM